MATQIWPILDAEVTFPPRLIVGDSSLEFFLSGWAPET
jgi:hypothetical protein